MESTSPRARTTSEHRSSNETLATRLGVGVVLLMGALGLTGCADHIQANNERASASPSPSETMGNSLTPDQLADIRTDCPSLDSLAGFDENVTKIPDDKAQLVLQMAKIGSCDAAGTIVVDWVRDQSK